VRGLAAACALVAVLAAPSLAARHDRVATLAPDLAARFAQPDQTIEYHLMLRSEALVEPALMDSFSARIAAPLSDLAEVGPLGPCRLAGYVDSPDHRLARHHLIVRLRAGRITLKARASSPSHLLDLDACSTRKYELDRFGAPEYSISTEVECPPGEVEPAAGTATVARMWDVIARECPALWRTLQPFVAGDDGLCIPGIAHMYDAKVRLRVTGAERFPDAGLTVWFFPPTGRSLVELSFTARVRDRAEAQRVYEELHERLRATHRLDADRASKTRRYFAAYAAGAPAPRRP
jgi:hypothetical protein